MEATDFQNLTHLSQALWSEPRKSMTRAQDTLAVVSLLNLSTERTTARVMAALLRQAIEEGTQGNLSALNEPFYRLNPEERVILSALHVCAFSYARLSAFFSKPVSEIGAMAWYARIQLAHSLQAPYPTGSPHRSHHCPEYDARNPWTQRFLDEEITGSEKLYLQNHLMACGHCRAALGTCRNLYYTIEESIPRVKGGGQLASAVENLKDVVQTTERTLEPWKHDFKSSLKVFVQHRDVQVALALVSIATLWKLLS